MTTGMVQDQKAEKQLQKQMGCMSGFLQIFDRHQMLSGKRLTTKRLPAPKHGIDDSPGIDKSFNSTDKFAGSPVITKETEKSQVMKSKMLPSPEPPSPVVVSSPELPPKSPRPLPLFEVNEGSRNSWKFSPRLSLDSRVTFDAAKGSLYRKEIQTNASITSANRCDNSDGGTDVTNRRSTSVVARLMGIEPLSNSSTPEPIAKHAELRRSASDSRVSRDIFQSQLIDGNKNDNFQVKQQNQTYFAGNYIRSNVIRENHVDTMEKSVKYMRSDQTPKGYSNRGFKSPQQRKSFFNTADFFPEPKQTVSIYGEIERRLRMRGIEEPSKDLETLKQILEAMQLKGLLHSKPTAQIRNKNVVYDHSYSSEAQSPIVLMKPFKRRLDVESPPSNIRSKSGNHKSISPVSPRRQRQNIDRNVNSSIKPRNQSAMTGTEINAKNRSNSIVKIKPLTIETQRRVNEPAESRRVSPISSPRISPRRNVPDQTATNRSPRNRRPTTQIHAKEKIINTIGIEYESSSSISESSVSTPSQTDTEIFKKEEHKEGRRMLDRCDKLLNSIAEMNANELQPSPVSVLDSSFYKDDSSPSPSPVVKRNITFPVEMEDVGRPGISYVQSKCEYDIDDPDFAYISEILGAWSYVSEEANDHIFLLLEKQQYLKCKDTSNVSKVKRRLIFDTVTEIIEQNRHSPPWKAFATKTWSTIQPSAQQIWSEFQRIQEHEQSDDLFEVICGVLKKDLAGDAVNGWADYPLEMSEAVLDIERLIFKDLVGESIRYLAELAAKGNILGASQKVDVLN